MQPAPPMANHTTTTTSSSNPSWLLDSAASHHVTPNLSNLSLSTPYEGPDDIVLGNGSGLHISHSGHATLDSFSLSNILCVPSMHHNLISVSQLCSSNNITIEFFPSFFLVKDRLTGAPLLRGESKNNVYEWPNTRESAGMIKRACVGQKLSPETWHNRLGHPSSKVFQFLASNQIIPSTSFKKEFNCDSCMCSKSHRLPFGMSSLISRKPLDLLYTDVWGPSPVKSLDGFSYYLLIVDHFTKYVWLFPMKFKSDTLPIFTKFKAMIENYFSTPIVTLYSDGGGEFLGLKPFLEKHGIQHLLTPPYTPQHNAPAERRHRHVVETGLSLLHHASLPLTFWTYAFQTAVYLINRLPTPILHWKTIPIPKTTKLS